MVICYIAVGSNLGDRAHYIQTALRKIRQIPQTRLLKVSSLIETPPEGGPVGQGPYLNGVLQVETDLFPYHLLGALQKIEHELGRVRTCLNAPRPIDLDILTYGDAMIHEEALCIPHPRMLTRRFVLEPLEQISPGMTEKVRAMTGARTARKPGKKPARGIKEKKKR